MRTEAEDKGLDSNGDAETLHVEAKDNLLDTIEERALSQSRRYCIFASADTIEEWKLSYFTSIGTRLKWKQ